MQGLPRAGFAGGGGGSGGSSEADGEGPGEDEERQADEEGGGFQDEDEDDVQGGDPLRRGEVGPQLRSYRLLTFLNPWVGVGRLNTTSWQLQQQWK